MTLRSRIEKLEARRPPPTGPRWTPAELESRIAELKKSMKNFIVNRNATTGPYIVILHGGRKP